MIQHRQVLLDGVKVDIVEAKTDEIHSVQISVLGEPSFTSKPFKDYSDSQLEGFGYKKLALVNGALFFPEGSSVYSVGVEKSMGVVNENDDPTYDNCMGFYHINGIPYIVPQSYIKWVINQSNVRGAITAGFGLLNNGVADTRGGNIGQPNRSIFLAKSGRTIIGKRRDNTLVFATFDGETGVSGLTGSETVQLAIDLNLYNAVCMDGGGSTYLEYMGKTMNGSNRMGPNAVAIYYKEV